MDGWMDGVYFVYFVYSVCILCVLLCVSHLNVDLLMAMMAWAGGRMKTIRAYTGWQDSCVYLLSRGPEGLLGALNSTQSRPEQGYEGPPSFFLFFSFFSIFSSLY